MADLYGGVAIPVPVANPPNTFPPEQEAGDPMISYLANFLTAVMTTYCGAAWTSVSPSTVIVKTSIANNPEDGFNEAQLPALYVFRPGRETREQVETFEQVADDYRFQKGRIEARWILNTAQQVNQRLRNQLVDAVRKVIDRAINIGRDPCWIVPGDLDPKAATQGSSLLGYTGGAVIELSHAAPGTYNHKMMLPAPQRHYDELKMSFYVEELLQRDITLLGAPHTTAGAQYQSPDQGTGLGPLDLGDAIYT